MYRYVFMPGQNCSMAVLMDIWKLIPCLLQMELLQLSSSGMCDGEFCLRTQTGFTLVELMVTVAVLAILLMIATADYGSTINRNNVVASINQLQGEVAYIRSAATKASTTVTFCSSSDSASCNGGTSWESGWIIFTDTDADAVVDAGERILRVGSPPENVSIRRSGFNFPAGRIQFNSRGEQRGDALPGSFSICVADGNTEVAKGLVVQVSGSTRRMVDENGDNIVNTHSGNAVNISCP